MIQRIREKREEKEENKKGEKVKKGVDGKKKVRDREDEELKETSPHKLGNKKPEQCRGKAVAMVNQKREQKRT